jgi:hypothetical protein
MDNKFVLVQNVIMDQVSRDSEYYQIFLEEIFVAYMIYWFVGDMFSQVVYGNWKNTTFCIIDVGCCLFLKHLEGNKNMVKNILFVNDGVIKF